MRLDLGCGPHCRDGYEGVDLEPQDGVVHVFDLEEPWPLPDDCCEGLFSSHTVEHLRDLVHFMNEAWRVAKPGAEFMIRHPYQFSRRAWQDPTHVRALNEVTWTYFDKVNRQGTREPLYRCDWRLITVEAIPAVEWMNLPPEEIERAAKNLVNVWDDLEIVLECRK